MSTKKPTMTAAKVAVHTTADDGGNPLPSPSQDDFFTAYGEKATPHRRKAPRKLRRRDIEAQIAAEKAALNARRKLKKAEKAALNAGRKMP